MNGRFCISVSSFHSAPNRLLISELCILGFSTAILRRCPLLHTMNAFIGRLICDEFWSIVPWAGGWFFDENVVIFLGFSFAILKIFIPSINSRISSVQIFLHLKFVCIVKTAIKTFSQIVPFLNYFDNLSGFIQQSTFHRYKKSFVHPQILFIDKFQHRTSSGWNCFSPMRSSQAPTTLWVEKPFVDNTKSDTKTFFWYVRGKRDRSECVCDGWTGFVHNYQQHNPLSNCINKRSVFFFCWCKGFFFPLYRLRQWWRDASCW